MLRTEAREIRRLQILDGALRAFAERGYSQASNKDIAKAAGIKSAGLIYHYFENKEDLLRAVIEQYAPPVQLLAREDEIMSMPLTEGLTEIGRTYLRALNDDRFADCMRVFVAEALRSTEFAAMFREIGPMRIWRLIARYLQAQMDLGVLRHTDPATAALCFIGPLTTYLLSRVVLRIPEAAVVDADTLLSTNVATFLDGMKQRRIEIDTQD